MDVTEVFVSGLKWSAVHQKTPQVLWVQHRQQDDQGEDQKHCYCDGWMETENKAKENNGIS